MRTVDRFSALLLLSSVRKVLTETPAPPISVPPSSGPQPTATGTPLTVVEGHPDTTEAKKAVNTQYPLMACPELWGLPSVFCDAIECGGEALDRPGFCNRPLGPGHGPCKCVKENGNLVGPVTTIVQATADGKVATGTYELETISKYVKLRQKITATTIISSTTSDGSGLETAAAVVFAGGVAWFLAGFTGDAAAAAALRPPTEAPEHEDDKSCPNPEKKCEDCGGQNQVCTTGSESGCACKEKTCPTDDKKPECGDEACKGKEGKCTESEHKDCECKPQPECPDIKKQLFPCDWCGGGTKDEKSNAWKCKGVEQNNYQLKDCECHNVNKGSSVVHKYNPRTLQEILKMKEKMRNLPDRKDDGAPADAPPKGPWCLHGASPRGDRLPIEYCQCGDDKKTLTYSIAPQPSNTQVSYNPCPYTATKDSPTVTFSNKPSATPKRPLNLAPDNKSYLGRFDCTYGHDYWHYDDGKNITMGTENDKGKHNNDGLCDMPDEGKDDQCVNQVKAIEYEITRGRKKEKIKWTLMAKAEYTGGWDNRRHCYDTLRPNVSEIALTKRGWKENCNFAFKAILDHCYIPVVGWDPNDDRRTGGQTTLDCITYTLAYQGQHKGVEKECQPK